MSRGGDGGDKESVDTPWSIPANSDAWFRSIVEAANEGIWIIDLQARTIFANERMANMLGVTPADMLGRPPSDFLIEEHVERARDAIGSSLGGTNVDFEVTFRRSDGVLVPMLAGSAAVRDRSGAITGSVATFSDLTARKASEEAMKRTNAEFQALADNIPTLCWMAHANGHIYWYNKRWYDYSGTSPDSQDGWGWESIHDPAVLPQVVSRWRASLATGTPFEMTFPLRGADGVFRLFLTRVAPIRDADGAITHWFGTNTDVDSLTRAQAALQLRTAELESLYGSAPIGLAFFDRHHCYLRVNPELAEINGIPAEQHIGRTLREIVPANAAAVEAAIDRVFATGEAVRDLEITGETLQQPGTRRHWLTGFYPVRGESNQVDAVGAWVVEISERKAAQERELLLAREVDHRAKNLLAVVQSIVQLTPADDGAALKHSVIGRIQALARAHSLLSDSRWDGVDLGQLVAEELAPFASDGEARVTHSGPKLTLRPAAAQSLALVLHELATNAAKYGALSNDQGRLAIAWHSAEDTQGAFIEIHWTESGGPPVTAPAALGFGSNIIRASVERQLRGKVTKQWLPGGLSCTLRIPAAEIVPGAVG